MLETELGLTPSPPLGREGQRTACPAGIHKGCWGCGSVLMDKVGVSKGYRGGKTLLCFRESNYSFVFADSKMHGFSQ